VNRDSLWIVVGVAAIWVSFLLGYAVSVHTGATLAGGPKAAAGGYGKVQPKGAEKQSVQETKKGPN
jgi:hypothetical protein